MSEKSLDVDDSRVAGPLTMPLVSSSFDAELASAPLPARLQQVMQSAQKQPAHLQNFSYGLQTKSKGTGQVSNERVLPLQVPTGTRQASQEFPALTFQSQSHLSSNAASDTLQFARRAWLTPRVRAPRPRRRARTAAAQT